MKKTFLFIVLCSLLLASCRQKTEQQQQPDVYSSLIEIIGKDSLITPDALNTITQINHLKINFYKWKNHLVIYGKIPNSTEIRKQIEQAYPEFAVRSYEQPFYLFDRKNCDDKTSAEHWSHTIMTANLVADTVLQQEYMNYHTRQAELFPEVSQGFCRATFQQLSVFRNERQLMLVISIPEGENLDDLNPKTTANNPRVNEWNDLMAKYQEGIEGTLPGETWVILNPVQSFNF